MLTDEQVKEQRNDKEMMLRPHLWPGGMFLFVKNTKNRAFKDWEVGTLHKVPDNDSRQYKYFIAIIDFVPSAEHRTVRFNSIDEVIDAGWVVD